MSRGADSQSNITDQITDLDRTVFPERGTSSRRALLCTGASASHPLDAAPVHLFFSLFHTVE